MKRLVVILLTALVLTGSATAARAELRPAPATDDYDDSQSHPLRVVAYLLNPAGFALEWLVFRPFHRLVSQPSLAPMFGHRDHTDDSTIGTR
ncbi:MAG: hypothetical protein HYR72_04755 [Deltaproteobacteria bacterium]|nr:hypothetical protein [Deltaproteobacteria bacterium]MBI3389804.1 hypothetical protein [Deltaproteobacteria bacterium]